MYRVVHTVYRGLDLVEHHVGTNDLNEFISWEPNRIEPWLRVVNQMVIIA